MPRRWAPIPASSASGSMKDAPGGQFEVHPDCVAAAEEAAGLLESLGHDVAESYPQALDDPHYTERFIQRWTAGVAWNLDYWSRKTGKEVTEDGVEPSTWALAEMGRSLRRGGLPQRPRIPAAGGPGRRRLVERPVRPAALADDGRAAHTAGGVCAGAGQPGGPDLPLYPDGGLHGLLELGRSTRDLPAASLDGGPPADRDPAGRPAGARGRADPGRGRSSRRRVRGPTGFRHARVPRRGNPFRLDTLRLMPEIGGVITAMVTPFAEDRSVDEAAARAAGAAPDRERLARAGVGRDDGRVADARRRREARAAARCSRRARRRTSS